MNVLIIWTSNRRGLWVSEQKVHVSSTQAPGVWRGFVSRQKVSDAVRRSPFVSDRLPNSRTLFVVVTVVGGGYHKKGH